MDNSKLITADARRVHCQPDAINKSVLNALLQLREALEF